MTAEIALLLITIPWWIWVIVINKKPPSLADVTYGIGAGLLIALRWIGAF